MEYFWSLIIFFFFLLFNHIEMKLIYLKRKKWNRTSSAAGQTDYETLISVAWGKPKLFFKYLFYRALAFYFLKEALT